MDCHLCSGSRRVSDLLFRADVAFDVGVGRDTALGSRTMSAEGRVWRLAPGDGASGRRWAATPQGSGDRGATMGGVEIDGPFYEGQNAFDRGESRAACPAGCSACDSRGLARGLAGSQALRGCAGDHRSGPVAPAFFGDAVRPHRWRRARSVARYRGDAASARAPSEPLGVGAGPAGNRYRWAGVAIATCRGLHASAPSG